MLARVVDPSALLLLIAAHATPVALAKAIGHRWAAPIDGGRMMDDGRGVLGSHKTWRGLIGGTLAASAVGETLGLGLLLGALFGFIALLGDLASSFTKRRLGHTSGTSVPLLDQLPEALFPMVILYGPLELDALSLTGTALTFLVLNLLFSHPFRGTVS